MRAIVQDRYGGPDVLRVRDIPRPAVADDEVLVRVRAASVHPDVWHVLTGQPYLLRLMGAGVRRPRDRVPGTDVAGVVAAAGRAATRFRPGDEVFGETMRGHQWRNGGAFAEYVAVPEEVLAAKPAGVTFAQAAAVPTAGSIALMNLPDGAVLRPGATVLVNGAGGGVGGIAVQLAKARGATVTGVDHPAKLELVRALGADHVVDCSREDFTRLGRRYDLVFDVPGNHRFAACRRAVAPAGTYVLIGHDHFGRAGRRWFGSVPRFGALMLRTPFTRQLPRPRRLPPKAQLMAILRDHLAAGELAPVIDRTFPLEEAAEAVRFLASGQARGRIVVTA